jgi:hypothetical protein
MTTEAEAVEAERLRHLRAEIEALLREYDACGVVYLAGKEGRFETFNAVEASWSNLHYCVGPQGDEIRIRSKAVDYPGDPERQRRDLAWSLGVVSGLALVMAHTTMGWIKAAELFDQKTGATHTDLMRDDPRDEGGQT